MLALSGIANAHAQPTFSKAFWPDTIGPGSTSALVFTIDNSGGGTPAEDLAFTDTLPAGMTLASPGFASNSCRGTVSAPDGGTTVSLSGGAVGAGASCEIVVNVSSSVPDVLHTNVSGDLTSDAGNSGLASAELIVDTGRPGFSKSFAPTTVEFGGRSTLTFTIDNTANGSAEGGLGFIDNLPAGMVIADPSDSEVAGCDALGAAPMLSADPGTDEISFLNGAVGAGQTCTITVDVIGDAVGELGNVSGDLGFSPSGSAGKASAVLEVTGFQDLLSIEKEFVDDPVVPGGTATLEFTITNRSRRDAATGITFTDDLETTLAGLTASSLPTEPCGAGSTLTGTSLLTLTGGNLPAEGSCTFTVTLEVPGGASPGTFANTTSDVSGTVGGASETGNAASDALFVAAFPVLTKTFTDDPVAGGGTVTLQFTITNTDSSSALSSIEFTDDLETAITGLAANGLVAPGGLDPEPRVDICGSGSELTVPDPNDSLPSPPFSNFPPDPTMLIFTGGSLAAGGSCSFEVVLDVPGGALGSVYTNTSSEITGELPGPSTVTGPAASGDVTVVGAPTLTKRFTDDPATPGGDVTLLFTLTNTNPVNDASDIAFSDDLEAALSGLTLQSVVSDGCNGSVGGLGTGELTYSGGTLPANDNPEVDDHICTIEVQVSVPDVAGGTFTNTTSSVSATVAGLATTSAAASDDLTVTGLQFSKAFSGDPVIAGDTATLTFTIDNTAGSENVTGMSFTDDLDSAIPGLSAALPPSPDPPCGGSSTLAGTSGDTVLTLVGGEVAAGASCSFSVTVTVPAGTADATYLNATGALTATIGGNSTTLPAATDDLTVDSSLIGLTKEFTDDPVEPGSTATLEFVVTNLSSTNSIAGITFSDDLDAALTSLTRDSTLFNDCSGSTVSGSDTVTVTGVSLAADASCTIRIAVAVPSGAATGASVVNTTSQVTGTAGAGLIVTGAPASDELEIQTLSLSKDFTGDPGVAGGTATLEFTITNMGSSPVSGLAFTDDLDKALSGLAADGLPDSNVCGAGSRLSGTSVLTFSGGILSAAGDPGDSCTFTVTVNVPAGATAGIFVNTTSALFVSGLPVADSATAQLEIEPPPTFSKTFAPDRIVPDGTSTLTFTIDNSASVLAADSLDFTDNLPAGVTVADPSNAAATCTGGTLTAAAGGGTVMYAGGTVAAGATCTVSVDVTGGVQGSFVNTSGDLTSSSGNSGSASDTLNVETDFDGDGTFDSDDPDDDNDGLDDINDPDSRDPDIDGDQIIGGLDPEPELYGNLCVGFGMPDEVTFTAARVPAGQIIVCAVPDSIMVAPPIDFEPTGTLVLISQQVSFDDGFAVPENVRLRVISADPTAPIVSPAPGP